MKGSSGRLVEIELPLEFTRTKVNINATTTAQQIVEIIEMRPYYQNSGYSFSLAAASSRKKPIPPHAPLIKETGHKFTLIITGIIAVVKIEASGLKETFTFAADATVKQCITLIECSNLKSNQYNRLSMKEFNKNKISIQPAHDLFLVRELTRNPKSFSVKNGEQMEYNKLISSYRLKQDNGLILSRSASCENFSLSEGGKTEEITVEVFCPFLNTTTHLELPIDTSFGKIVKDFLEPYPAENPWFYALCYRLPTGKHYHYLQPNWTLQTFAMASPVGLICCRKNYVQREWFGVEPSSLVMAQDPDNGIEVPEILLILKHYLVSLKGYQSEGIFRKAGLESEMTTLKVQLGSGLPFSCDNQHTIATIIKRWFKALPKRLLAGVDRADDSVAFHTNYSSFMNNIDTRLSSWLFDLLLSVLEYESVNLMDPKNCAIVWGPGMVGSSDEVSLTGSSANVMEGFNDTRFGINFIQMNLSHFRSTSTPPFGIFPISRGAVATLIKDHISRTEGELTAKEGDTVIIQDNSYQEWSFVKHETNFGFVAKSFLKFS